MIEDKFIAPAYFTTNTQHTDKSNDYHTDTSSNDFILMSSAFHPLKGNDLLERNLSKPVTGFLNKRKNKKSHHQYKNDINELFYFSVQSGRIDM